MGTAGLDVKRLSGLLERMKVDCILAHGDKSHDHCILRLSSVKRPNAVALIEYVNDGMEPRNVGMIICTEAAANEAENTLSEWQYQLVLSGPIKSDPEK